MTVIILISAINLILSVAILVFFIAAREGWNKTADALEASRDAAWNKLHALRDNCFLANEEGHCVPYRDASKTVRAKAEGGAE